MPGEQLDPLTEQDSLQAVISSHTTTEHLHVGSLGEQNGLQAVVSSGSTVSQVTQARPSSAESNKSSKPNYDTLLAVKNGLK